MIDPQPLLRFLLDAAARGQRAALVTVTALDGPSARAVGAQMAVREDGAWSGSLSGGCTEDAVAGAARAAIAAGQPQKLRIGRGSPLIDIRLPCGGGMDLLIVPMPNRDVLKSVLGRLDQRHAAAIELRDDGTITQVDLIDPSAGLIVHYRPVPRVVLIGHGDELIATARQAQAFGAEVVCVTPDARSAQAVAAFGEVETMADGSSPVLTPIDAATAVILLFHQHEWEDEHLRRALDSEAFLIGAMGSRAAHDARIERLRAAGIDAAALTRIIGPIGLIPAVRQPEMLGVSIVAQIAQAWQARASI